MTGRIFHAHAPDNTRGDIDDWTADALCAQTDPELFYPEKGGSVRAAKRICNGHDDTPPCPVKARCLADALDADDRFGIYGGLSERERRPLHQQHARNRDLPHRCECGASYRTAQQLNGHRSGKHHGSAA